MGLAYGYSFKRVEKKYLLTEEQKRLLMEKIADFVEPDLFPHSDISNIYYDTVDNELIRRSMDKPIYKEKLRLRTYGIVAADSQAFIEIKKKYKGIVYKRRVMLPLQEAEGYLNDGRRPAAWSQVLEEVDYFRQCYHPIPRLFLSYERDSFVARDEFEVRITFDTNLRSRREELQLEKNLGGQALLEKDTWIMEIKVPMAYPLWLTKALSELKLYPISFSKYGTVYCRELTKEI